MSGGPSRPASPVDLLCCAGNQLYAQHRDLGRWEHNTTRLKPRNMPPQFPIPTHTLMLALPQHAAVKYGSAKQPWSVQQRLSSETRCSGAEVRPAQLAPLR